MQTREICWLQQQHELLTALDAFCSVASVAQVASTVLESLGASVYHHRAARVYRNKLIVCAGDAEAVSVHPRSADRSACDIGPHVREDTT